MNQDDLGNRRKCEDMTRTALASQQNVIIDRCNFDAKQRSHWVEIAKKFTADAYCLMLNTPIEVASISSDIY